MDPNQLATNILQKYGIVVVACFIILLIIIVYEKLIKPMLTCHPLSRSLSRHAILETL